MGPSAARKLFLDERRAQWPVGYNLFTFYAQALLSCVDEYDARAQDGSYKLCIVVTDGELTEDTYTQCVDGGALDTMEYTSSMVDDYYNARYDGVQGRTCQVAYAYDLWVAPGAYAFCQARGLSSCTVDSMTDYVKGEMGVKILNVMVGSFDDAAKEIEVESCCHDAEVETCYDAEEDYDYYCFAEDCSDN